MVSCADALLKCLRAAELIGYVVAQVQAAIVGVDVANPMFSLPAVSLSTPAPPALGALEMRRSPWAPTSQALRCLHA